MPRERSGNVIEIDVSTDADTVLPQQEAASFMATFWDRVITEFNVANSLSNAASIQALPDNSDALPPPQPFEKQDSDALFSSAEDIGPKQKLGKKGERERTLHQRVFLMRHSRIVCLVASRKCQRTRRSVVGKS